ncbi:MAG: alanine/glycine:cation symporter family protein, partial [Oscillospiraceae bacterium]
MDAFVKAVESINGAVNGFVWGIPMLVLIISTGIYMTVRTHFFQVTKIKHWSNETFLAIFKKKSVTKTKDKKAISQFQALATALAATIGTGNIAGVATAIAVGGPGAVFWMWLSAFFGMMTNYSENVLGIYFRKKNVNGEWSGGAMYYLQEGLKDRKGIRHLAKPLAILFSIFCVLASFGIGNMTQVNSISSAMKSNFNVPTIITGIVLAAIAALVIVGGIKRIASVTEKLVPFMALFYIIGCLIIFVSNYKQIPYVFSSIFSNAFNFGAVAGGIGGYIIKRAVTMGFKRGVFSNEAGLGSSVMVHSASDVKEPVVQGMWGIFEVFFDTIIVCTLTAFVLLSSPAESKTFDEAMQSISTEAQYFEIHTPSNDDTVSLIDANINPLFELADENAAEGTYTEYA